VADFNQINQFGSAKPARSGEGTSCAECEAMLMDALDGVLSAKEQAAFDLHIATCAECGQMLEDAKRGAAMLEVLKFYRPEPSAALFERILAQTNGLATAAPVKSQDSGILAIPGIDGAAVEIHSIVPSTVGPAGSGGIPSYGAATGKVLPFRSRVAASFHFRAITHTMMQPRLAMTAAMAFFSIALTLNLTGVRLNELRASDLAPTNLRRSFYHANASVVRYYENLRVVYELESRVNEFKQANPGDTPREAPGGAPGAEAPGDPARVNPDKAPEQSKPRKAPKSSSGTSERRGIEGRRGMEERLNAWGGDLKLAGYRSGSRGTMTVAAVASSNGKSNESLQKGDLV
jgi:hypothetical protein